MCNIYDTLLRYDTETCEVVAGLSEMPEISDDGLTYTFKLQEGVKFHDGTDCDAGPSRPPIERQLEPNHRGHALCWLCIWRLGLWYRH